LKESLWWREEGDVYTSDKKEHEGACLYAAIVAGSEGWSHGLRYSDVGRALRDLVCGHLVLSVCRVAQLEAPLISRAAGENKFARLLSATSAQGYGGRQASCIFDRGRSEGGGEVMIRYIGMVYETIHAVRRLRVWSRE
jgi:hypothetical protein